MKTIGIIGAGKIGKAVAAHLVNAGFEVLVSNSRGSESLEGTIKTLGEGAKAVAISEAVNADIVLLALPWSKVGTLKEITNWTGKIVMDATNHFTPDYQLEDLGGRASSEVVRDLLPGARVVKAFNTLFAKLLAADPTTENGHRVLFISGDEPDAKAQVSEVIEAIGFAPIDLGSLSIGSKFQEAKGVLSTLNLVKL